jgi:broad-specificity NMP kinase
LVKRNLIAEYIYNAHVLHLMRKCQISIVLKANDYNKFIQ